MLRISEKTLKKFCDSLVSAIYNLIAYFKPYNRNNVQIHESYSKYSSDIAKDFRSLKELSQNKVVQI